MIETIPKRNFSDQDYKPMTCLISPDGQGPWAVRYLWIQHRDDNEKFYNNYFTGGNQKGLNVRKNTEHLQKDWTAHNLIFEESAKNGNLVYRIKIGNEVSQSIDYIEIWKSKEILLGYFGYDDVKLNDDIEWQRTERKLFAEKLFNAGFDIRYWSPYPLISKKLALEYYKSFVEKFKKRENCIINTSYNRDLNPP